MNQELTEFKNFHSKLNSEQKKAVDTLEGPVLVLAGPGTGKTQVLTMRIANILLKTDAEPDSILALTFTESGVRAMKERLISIIGPTAYKVNIHTFHSFASSIIQSNLDEFAMSPSLEPLSDLEKVYIFREIFDELDLKLIKPFNSPYYYLSSSMHKINELKQEGLDPNEYFKEINNSDNFLNEKDQLKNFELHKVYSTYQEKLKKYSRYDFQDMINFVIDKFKSDNNFLRRYQERFQYFLVDEFQDTNSSQAKLLYLLNSHWEENPNLFVVGDDDQSIYRFQGASLENILTFNEKYPNSEKIVLKTNYRSIQPVLNAATNLIEKNKQRIDKNIDINKSQESALETNEEIALQVGEFSSSYTENHFIASKIKELIKNGTPAKEIAVIYRRNNDAKEISDMLARLEIEYEVSGGENILQSGIIIRLIHLLKSIDKVSRSEEDLDLFTLLNYEFLKFNKLDILKLTRFAKNRKIPLFDALIRPDLNKSEIEDIEKFLEMKNKLAEWNAYAANHTFIDFLDHVINDSGFLNWILDQKTSYEYLNKLNSFLSEARKLNISDRNLTLEKFLHYIDLMEENRIQITEQSIEMDIDAVKLMTAHKSKGLEFEHVFVPQFIDKKWNDATSRDYIKLPKGMIKSQEIETEKDEKEFEREDDRRLVYVVLTRAKNNIIITSAKNYNVNGIQRESIPSIFLYEVDESNKALLEISKYESDASQILKEILKEKNTNYLTTQDEKNFLKSSLRNFRLSPTSLNTYIECPYKFKLNSLFRIQEPTKKHLALGNAVHASLEKAYTQLSKFRKPVDLNFLQLNFEKALRKEILTEKDLLDTLEEGKTIIKIYYETYSDEFQNPKSNTTLSLEKWFGQGFSSPMLDGNIPLHGKIDRIDTYPNDTKSIKIIDYKTGNPKSRNEILGKTQKSDESQYRQLLFYKLLVELDGTINKHVAEVQLDFIGKDAGKNKPKRETFSITKDEIDMIKETIREVHKSINNLEFNKTTNYSVCEKCQFHDHCWPDGKPSATSVQLGLV